MSYLITSFYLFYVGFISAITILTEIKNFQGFLKPKLLVAYIGVNPSINESGKFKNYTE
ncbi:transposase [Clostridium botulinum]|nr:transposase [Clostridium botulinum]EKO2041335.1 transposase [Clostridium botulinum]